MKIAFLPYQPHCFAFGGFEMQMLATFNAVKELGADVIKLNVWDTNADFDILHCWGVGLGNYENIYWAKKAGKKVVITILLEYLENLQDKLKFNISLLLHRQKLAKQMLEWADEIVVVNKDQASICIHNYKISSGKISVIPHIVSDIFFDAGKSTTSKDYVLITGNVCERKNQIRLALACIQEKLPLVIIGKILDGQQEYGEKLNNIIKDQSDILWIKGLDNTSNELLSYFSNCRIMALPSFSEQQPISMLEAAILGKPLLMANKPYAKQEFYKKSCLVDPVAQKNCY